MTPKRTIPPFLWLDMEGRAWMDTGMTKEGERVIELLNGKARGVVSWVEKEFGPLEELGKS